MTLISEAELEEIKARNPIAEVAGGYVKLRRSGTRIVGACPLCGGRVTSQRFEIFEKDQGFACAACHSGGDVIRLIEKAEGCSFLEAIERLGGRVQVDPEQAKRLFEEREHKRLKREKEAKAFREAERKRLHNVWKGAVKDLAGTPVETYLRGRGLQLPERSPGLRYLPSMAYYQGEEINERGRKAPRKIHIGPAMCAAFIRGDGTFGGLHLTWIEVITSPGDVMVSKAEIADPDTGEILPSKKMRGSKTGAHIAVALTEAAPRHLVIGEGIETTLAVWTAHQLAGRDTTDMAFWAAGDLGNLAGRAIRTINHPTLKRPNGRAQTVPDRFPDPDDPGLAIPDSVEELILLGDGDSEPLLTECAMERAARRYAREGRAIRIAFAPAGRDFNDVLRGEAV